MQGQDGSTAAERNIEKKYFIVDGEQIEKKKKLSCKIRETIHQINYGVIMALHVAPKRQSGAHLLDLDLKNEAKNVNCFIKKRYRDPLIMHDNRIRIISASKF